MANLVIRVTILLSLIISLVIMVSNSATLVGLYGESTVRYKNVNSYRYMVTSAVLGMIYSLLQIPVATQRVTGGKTLPNSARLLQFDFYGDKVLLSLLATGVGAAFGATVDLKKNFDALDDLLEQFGSASLSQWRTKLDNFFNVAYLSTGFLLVAFLTSIVSSTLSSPALSKKG
ncbi:hypothetical protein NMG60_11024874 [Bertholletia excelsa]